MKNPNSTFQLIRLSVLTFLLSALPSANAQAATNHQQNDSLYVYQMDTESDWKVIAARMIPHNDSAKFSAKIFHRHKRAVYPAADVQLRIVDATGKLLGTARATPEQIFNAEKAWRKTGVNYTATLDFVPPTGSRVEVVVNRAIP